MKLLTKTTIYFLAAMVALLGFTGVYLFIRFNEGLNERSDKEMLYEELQWVNYLQSATSVNATFRLHSRDISIYPTDAPAESLASVSDAGQLPNESGIMVPYRQLRQIVGIGQVNYQIDIKKSQEQKLALVRDFTRIILVVFAGLFLATLIFNWAISRRLWRPFRQSLQKIRSTDLQKMQTVHFNETNTTEFNELNATLNLMTGKIYNDFLSMKEFTENAAHEMQTPIAVIQSKLEILLQDNNLREDQMASLIQVTEALTRLSRLNQDLLLLAKIENNQYATTVHISLRDVIRKYLVLFSELIREKHLNVTIELEDDLIVTMHESLADSLISNLLGNAIKHNFDGGSLSLKTTTHSFEISNTSRREAIPKNRLFSRFHMNTASRSSSTGLGLAIVKKIIDSTNLRIRYHALGEVHSFYIEK